MTTLPPKVIVRKPLTDAALRKAKPPSKTTRLSVGRGMYAELTPQGGKLFRLKYRFGGKEKRLSLGTYPDTSLEAACRKGDAARALLAQGIDPSAHRKAEKAAGAERAANSFEVVAREWLGKRTWVADYKVKVVAWFENDVFPWIGSRPIADLTTRDFLAVAQRIEARGAYESAHRIMQNCSQVMRYAIATTRAERNPVVDLKGALTPAPEKHHAAITAPDQVGGLLRAIDGYVGATVTKCALRFAPLVFVRPGELRQAEWAEIDLAGAEWNIPKERMKMREPHLVPLSKQAVTILRELQPITGRGRYVFPSARDPKRAMSNNAVLAALRRMGFSGEEMTGHGFRAMARTILDEVLNFRPDIIEHQLAHQVLDPNGRAYNRTSHLPDRRKMMQAWADYLDKLKGATNSSGPTAIGAQLAQPDARRRGSALRPT